MYDNVKTVDSGGFVSTALGFLKGAAIAVVLTLTVFLVFAFILSYTPLSEGAIVYIAYITELIGAAVAGFVPARRAGTKGLLTGAVSGFLYILIIWVIASLAADGFFIGRHILTMLAMSVAAGAVGGIFGVNTKASVNNKKKR